MVVERIPLRTPTLITRKASLVRNVVGPVVDCRAAAASNFHESNPFACELYRLSDRQLLAGWRRLQLYVASTHGHGDLVGDVLSLSLSWIVVWNDLNRINFKTTSKFSVRPSHPGKYFGHMIRQVKLDRRFRPIHRE